MKDPLRTLYLRYETRLGVGDGGEDGLVGLVGLHGPVRSQLANSFKSDVEVSGLKDVGVVPRGGGTIWT